MPLTPKQKERFLSEYQTWAKKYERNLDPYDPEHFYDYEGAWLKNGIPEGSHWPSEFKKDEHPDRFLYGLDTRDDIQGALAAMLGALE